MTWHDPECDCWTNEEGYWELGPRCRQVELNEWGEMMKRLPETISRIRRKGMFMSPRRAVRFVMVDGKMRMIEDVYLPKDAEDK